MLEVLGEGLRYASYAAAPGLIGKSMSMVLSIDDTDDPEQGLAAIVVTGLVTNALGSICRQTAKNIRKDLDERLPT